MADIFEQVSHELLFTPTPPPADPATTAGENDELVEQTFNGLRPDDVALEQPPQDRGWRP